MDLIIQIEVHTTNSGSIEVHIIDEVEPDEIEEHMKLTVVALTTHTLVPLV